MIDNFTRWKIWSCSVFILFADDENDDTESDFASNLRQKFGLEKDKNTSKKRKKVENGLGLVSVDEDKVGPKKAKKAKISSDPGSIEEGQKCFEWMIQPIKRDEFFKEIWERRPFHIKRGDTQPQYYKHLFSTKSFDELLRSHVRFLIFWVFMNTVNTTHWLKLGSQRNLTPQWPPTFTRDMPPKSIPWLPHNKLYAIYSEEYYEFGLLKFYILGSQGIF